MAKRPITKADVRRVLPGDMIGRNVTAELDGAMLTIRCDVTQDGVESGSGKSIVIGSTNGNVAVPGTDLKLGLNLYRPNS